MINIKNIGILIFATALIVSCNCKKKTTDGGNSDKTASMNKVTVKPGYTSPESNDAFMVDNAFIEGDNLTMYVTYGGGCKTHEFKAFASDVYMKSMPPKLGITVEHNANNDLCKALVSDTLIFDLSSVKYPGKVKDYTIVLSVNNWKGDLIYKY